MIVPIHVNVAAALPEIEPNIALAITDAALRPPLIRPINSSAKCTSGKAIFPRSMMPPARINSGMASKTRTCIFQWPAGINPDTSWPPNAAINNNTAPKAIGTETPITNKTHNARKHAMINMRWT